MNTRPRPSVVCPECGRPLPSEALSRLAGLRLSPSQRIIATTLAGKLGERVPTERLVDALYAHRSDGGPDDVANTMQALVYRLNRRLKAVGLSVEGKSNGMAGTSWRRMVMEAR